jgi:hypothetical protein
MVRKNNVEARCVLRSHQFGWELCLQVGLNRTGLAMAFPSDKAGLWSRRGYRTGRIDAREQ